MKTDLQARMVLYSDAPQTKKQNWKADPDSLQNEVPLNCQHHCLCMYG